MKIFISYRRSDTPDVSGRIYDELARHFGADTVFKDVDDIVVSHLLQTGQEGYHRVKNGGKVFIRGLGLAATLGTKMRGQQATFYETRPNGSSIMSSIGSGEVSSLAVDFSGASGAPALFIGIGPAFAEASHKEQQKDDGTKTRIFTGTVSGQPYAALVLTRDDLPQVNVAGEENVLVQDNGFEQPFGCRAIRSTSDVALRSLFPIPFRTLASKRRRLREAEPPPFAAAITR